MNQDNNTFVPMEPSNILPNNVVPNNTNMVNPAVASVQPQVAQVQAAPSAQPAGQQTAPATQQAATSTNPGVLICPKCGSEMKKESRYCMKCGQLNYAHPENESMKQYAWESIKQGHFISGANVDNKQPLTMGNVSSVSEVNPFKPCLITNIVLHVLLLVGLLVISGNFEAIATGLYIASALGVGIGFLLNYSTQAMFIKAGEPWWGYFVPFYNTYLMFKVGFGNGWYFLMMLIPVVGLVLPFVLLYQIGKKFYKSGWLTLFFPYVMIPIIALDKNCEYSMLAKSMLGDSAMDAKGRTQSEKEYGRNKTIITIIVVIIVAVVLYFAWPYLKPVLYKIYDLIMKLVEKIQSMN
ncbi:MAG: hypothetical protein IJA30_02060 [Bacilli bacterium]|nr:hypothetical protein [Bacilli bacterium]